MIPPLIPHLVPRMIPPLIPHMVPRMVPPLIPHLVPRMVPRWEAKPHPALHRSLSREMNSCGRVARPSPKCTPQPYASPIFTRAELTSSSRLDSRRAVRGGNPWADQGFVPMSETQGRREYVSSTQPPPRGGHIGGGRSPHVPASPSEVEELRNLFSSGPPSTRHRMQSLGLHGQQ